MKLSKPIIALSLTLFCATALAQSSEPIEGGRLSYQSGSFDPFSLNAQIEGITVTLQDVPPFNIARLIAKSRIDENDSQIIDRFSVEGITMDNPESETLTIDRLGIRNARGEEHIHWGNLSNMANFDGLFVAEHAELAGFLLHLASGERIALNRIKITSNAMSVGASQPRYAIKAEIKDFEFDSWDKTEGFGAAMAGVGIDTIRFNMQIEGETGYSGAGQYVDDTRVTMAIDQLAEIKSQSRVSFSAGLLEQIKAASLIGNEEAANALMLGTLMAAPLEADIAITITNEGLLEAVFAEEATLTGRNRQEVTTATMGELAMIFAPYAPRAFDAFAPEIEAWLMEGGSLTISTRPDGAVALADLLEEQVAGDFDAVWEKLGASVKRTYDDNLL